MTGLAADAAKLELARKFGADFTIDVDNENVKQRVRELTDGQGADVVVDVSSYATQPVAESLDYVRMGGTVVLAGVKGFKEIPGFISDKIVMKEIRDPRRHRRHVVRLLQRDPADRVGHATPIARPCTLTTSDLRDAELAIQHPRPGDPRRGVHPLLS